ncbi:GLPGLI family protein [Chryseobacterium sp.]|uniref:GLPGLI family protein n=1 Tax=Chryseobacterium sp. TaxID=1871047 RepID=UPI0026016264|nr:GLPGLI family protein [Chryseobacterium sp.]
MIRIFSAFILFAFTNTLAQTHRYYYNIEYKLDSLQKESQKKTMILDINPEDVKYYDYAFLVKDSINKKTNSQNLNWTDQIPVTRKRDSNKNLNYNNINFDLYTYFTDDKINWKLQKDTQDLEGFKLQKATCDFGGRKWVAWFTKDIPFSEGPYKFRGLPGLIVLLQDNQNFFNFSLIKSVNLKETYNTENILEVRYGNKAFPVTEKIFIKKSAEHYNDPFHDIKLSLANNPSGSFDYYGKRFTKDDDLTKITKEARERILLKNNPIEINKSINYNNK